MVKETRPGRTAVDATLTSKGHSSNHGCEEVYNTSV
jgi:hypothetical protein